MEEKEMRLSFLVITGFIFLFFIFMFIKPDTTGGVVASELVAGVGISEEFSVITLVLAFITLIVFLGIIFFVYKKLISKRHKKKEIPKPPIPKRDVLSGLDRGKELFDEHMDEDVEKFGSETQDFEKPELEQEETKVEKPIVKKEVVEPKIGEQKILTNLNQLKSSIINLLNQKYQKQDILRILEAKGWSIEQIVKAIDEINLDTLRIYVRKSLELGFNKGQIMGHLKRNGWDEVMIMKAFPK
ncbi:MAG: hypothetical protein ISS82_03685 [Nanoarchaeota archaeon]|nr:hypothetical protein [Nanoarchaeota archaeon]